MNQIDINTSLLDNPYRFNAADRNYINFNGNSNSKTVRDAIRERHRVRLYSNFGGSELSMMDMLDDSIKSNVTGSPTTLKPSNINVSALMQASSTTTPVRGSTLETLQPSTTSATSAPIIHRTVSPTTAASIPTPKTAILDTSVPAVKLGEVKTSLANQAAVQSEGKSSSQAPIVISGGGGGGGASSEEELDSSKVANEKKYFGLTKKQGLIVLGVLAVGTFAYFKYVKKAF